MSDARTGVPFQAKKQLSMAPCRSWSAVQGGTAEHAKRRWWESKAPAPPR